MLEVVLAGAVPVVAPTSEFAVPSVPVAMLLPAESALKKCQAPFCSVYESSPLPLIEIDAPQ